MTRNEAHPITVEVVRNAIVAYADGHPIHVVNPDVLKSGTRRTA